jgi:branched-chain amino acid aminotransferase
MVITFELVAGDVRRLSEHPTMRDASAVLPSGAYTTLRTYGRNRVVRLTQHLRRLEESAALMGGATGRIDGEAARHAIASSLDVTDTGESRLRLTFAPPRLYISVEPFEPYPQTLYDQGVWCVSVALHRQNPHAKSTAFIAPAADAYSALPPGAHEGLLLAVDGAILEGLSSNFFAVTPDRDELVLRTEESRALIGVTRSLVLEIARGILPVSTEAVAYRELASVRECFITSVSREILPVVKIDRLAIGDGHPGPITRDLIRRFRELVDREAEVVA